MNRTGTGSEGTGTLRRRTGGLVAAVAIAAGALVVAPSTAQALGTKTWTRSCGTTYQGISRSTVASTEKFRGGSCEGHAWLRVYRSNVGWTAWYHAPRKVTYSRSAGGISGAVHKGCGECTSYRT